MNIIEITSTTDTDNLHIEDKKITNGLYLTCNKCLYTKKSKDNILIIPYYSVREENTRIMNMSRMVEDYKHDSRNEVTKRMKCINNKCKQLNPEIVIVKHKKYTEAMYICKNCNHYWGKY